MRRFTIAPERIRDGRVFFDRDESRHLARVLRLRSGDTVLAADGAGHEYTVRLETIGDEATGTVLEVGANDHESPLRITLIQSVPKGDKMESIVRASTELGVTRIVPVLTARTIVTLEPGRWRDRARRWQRVAKEAAKQCGRAVVPPVHEALPIADALAQPIAAARIMFTEPSASGAGTVSLSQLPRAAAAELLIGPEGGWTVGERELAAASGCMLVTLGAQTIRAAAAPMVAITAVRAMWGDL